MNVFYNVDGIGDTLLVSIKDTDNEFKTFERKGDVARIFNKETSETLGYNIFAISSHLKITGVGQVKLTKELVREIQEVLSKNDFHEILDVDLSPKFIVGLVTEKEKHPNADKLSVCKVNVGSETLQIVCGAPNVDAGQMVVIAKVGAVMPSGLLIKDSELRGISSSGMICSARELKLPDASQEKGILVLENGYDIGQAFFE